MVKRLTDTEKWKDEWFCNLSNDMKLGWLYIIDSCDHAGIWQRNLKLLRYHCESNKTDEEIKDIYSSRIYEFNDRWFIPKFLKFQYPLGLISKKPVIISVVKILKYHDLMPKVAELFGNAYITINESLHNDCDYIKSKNKSKSINKNKSINKDKSKNKDNIEGIIADFNIVLGTNYKDNTKNTQDMIKARLNEGFTVDDFKVVHRKMLKNWGADAKMYKFLRPQTLYSNKFESYLNMREQFTKLTESGVHAYLVGQEWLKKKQQEESNVKS